MVRDGIEGFLVGPGDVDALAARMERLGNDPALREQMARPPATRPWPSTGPAITQRSSTWSRTCSVAKPRSRAIATPADALRRPRPPAERPDPWPATSAER